MTKLLFINKTNCILIALLFLFGCSDLYAPLEHSHEENDNTIEDIIPPASNIECITYYDDITGEISSCGEGCNLYSSYCFHQNDIKTLIDFRDINSSLSEIPILEIGTQTWRKGRLIEFSSNTSQINSIPTNFGNLTSLQYISFSGNYIFNFPEEIIYSLDSLRYIDLSDNNLLNISSNVAFWLSLENLEYFNLSGNNIYTLSENICYLADNCWVNLDYNKLCEEYNYDCLNFGNQDQSNCCEGPNGEPNWTNCD